MGDGAVWALTCCNAGSQLLKINPITLHVVGHLDLSSKVADGVAVGAGGVWMLSDHSVSKIDPRTDTIIQTFPLVRGRVGQLCGIAATQRQLWVSSGRVSCDTIGG